MRPRLLLVEDDPATRLIVTAALAGAFEVLAPAAGDDPVRIVRATNPALALVGVQRRPAEALRLTRALRTDLRPVSVAVLDPRARAPMRADAAPQERVDGYYGVPLDAESLRAFVADVIAGRRPFLTPSPARGPMSRFLSRLRGGTLP